MKRWRLGILLTLGLLVAASGIRFAIDRANRLATVEVIIESRGGEYSVDDGPYREEPTRLLLGPGSKVGDPMTTGGSTVDWLMVRVDPREVSRVSVDGIGIADGSLSGVHLTECRFTLEVDSDAFHCVGLTWFGKDGNGRGISVYPREPQGENPPVIEKTEVDRSWLDRILGTPRLRWNITI